MRLAMTTERKTICDICGTVAIGLKAIENWGWYWYSDRAEDKLDNDVDFCDKCTKLVDKVIRDLVVKHA